MGKTSTEVKTAWKQRNYKQYAPAFRFDTDMELINYIEDRRLHGDGTTDIFREGIKALMEKEGK